MEFDPGIRVRHRMAMLGAIETAAVLLVAQRGFDAVTAQDIAAEAEMTQRTFFRYCPAKVDAFRFGVHHVHRFVGELVLDPVDFAAVSDRVVQCLGRMEADPTGGRERLRRVWELVVSDPSLSAAMAARDAEQVVGLRSAWRCPDPFVVPITLLALRMSLETWASTDEVALGDSFRMTRAELQRLIDLDASGDPVSAGRGAGRAARVRQRPGRPRPRVARSRRPRRRSAPRSRSGIRRRARRHRPRGAG